MKKRDIIVMIGILLCCVILIVAIRMRDKAGAVALVKVDGKVVKTLPLRYDTEVRITGINNAENIIVVKDGYVYMKEANCKNHYCMKHKKISKDKETIVCLPHKLVIEVHAREKGDVDEK